MAPIIPLSLHPQYAADYLPDFVAACAGRLVALKCVDFVPEYEGVEILYRPFVDDGKKNALVAMGADGAAPYIDEMHLDDVDPDKVTMGVQGPNEFVMDTPEKVEAFNSFHRAFIPQLAKLGFCPVVGNINTGHMGVPWMNDTRPTAAAIRPTVEVLRDHGGKLSWHEYAGSFDLDAYSQHNMGRVFYNLQLLGEIAKDVDHVIGEFGIDEAVDGKPHGGWLVKNLLKDGQPDYHRMVHFIVRYIEVIRTIPRLKAAFLFTVCNWDWLTFNVDRQLAMYLAHYIRTGVSPFGEPPENGGDMDVPIFDVHGKEQPLGWAIEKYGDRWGIDRVSADAAYRIVELRERSGPSSYFIKVEGPDGSPSAGHPVARYWPDESQMKPLTAGLATWRPVGVTAVTKEENGLADFGGGSGDYYDPKLGEMGASEFWVSGASDRIYGIGWPDGTAHDSLGPVFRWVDDSGPQPEEVTLQLELVGQGKVQITPDTLVYRPGTVVRLEAVSAAEGWSWSHWSGLLVGDPWKPDIVEFIIEQDMYVTAVFVPDEDPYKLVREARDLMKKADAKLAVYLAIEGEL